MERLGGIRNLGIGKLVIKTSENVDSEVFCFSCKINPMKEFIYGRNAVYETLRAKRRQIFALELAEGAQEKGRVLDILELAKQLKVTVRRLEVNHQGVVLEVSAYPYSDELEILESARTKNEAPFVLILDSLQDPQNFGTLLRTAEATGVHGVVIPLAHRVEVTPAVVNASSGASEHLLIAQSNLAQTIETLKSENIWVVGIDQNGETIGDKTSRHLQGALGLVIGSEGDGMRPLVRSKCDILLKLPMRGQVESLNAAVAGSVALYLAYMTRTIKL
jgi:23S rRNA (guanosine2251-2'-O)-methyltransferase